MIIHSILVFRKIIINVFHKRRSAEIQQRVYSLSLSAFFSSSFLPVNKKRQWQFCNRSVNCKKKYLMRHQCSPSRILSLVYCQWPYLQWVLFRPARVFAPSSCRLRPYPTSCKNKIACDMNYYVDIWDITSRIKNLNAIHDVTEPDTITKLWQTALSHFLHGKMSLTSAVGPSRTSTRSRNQPAPDPARSCPMCTDFNAPRSIASILNVSVWKQND